VWLKIIKELKRRQFALPILPLPPLLLARDVLKSHSAIDNQPPAPSPTRLSVLPLMFLVRRWPWRLQAKKSLALFEELKKSRKIEIVPYQGVRIKRRD
jgi:hypothetical protein